MTNAKLLYSLLNSIAKQFNIKLEIADIMLTDCRHAGVYIGTAFSNKKDTSTLFNKRHSFLNKRSK